MKICYFGIYNPDYSRNHVIIRGLLANGIEVVECRTQKTGLLKYWDLLQKYRRLAKDFDFIIVGFPGNQAAVLAKLISSKPVILDAFLSFYDSMIFDRRAHSRFGPFAAYYWCLDFAGCFFADAILLDTQAHIDYFVDKFKIKKEKFSRIFVGSDDQLFFPAPAESPAGQFIVHFHGYFLPLQGIEIIIAAAKILEKEGIQFNLIGRGKTYDQIRKIADELQVKNISFINPVPYEKLRDYIVAADVCLGVFGRTAKAGRVIPNKVFEALACRRPVITADQPVIGELLQDGKEVLLCRPYDAADLAEKILLLKNNRELAATIAAAGHELFKRELTPKELVKKLLIELNDKFHF